MTGSAVVDAGVCADLRLVFITAAPEDFVPEPVRGQPVVGITVVYVGPVEEGQEVRRPLLEFGPPGVAGPTDALCRLAADAPTGQSEGMHYWSADFLTTYRTRRWTPSSGTPPSRFLR